MTKRKKSNKHKSRPKQTTAQQPQQNTPKRKRSMRRTFRRMVCVFGLVVCLFGALVDVGGMVERRAHWTVDQLATMQEQGHTVNARCMRDMFVNGWCNSNGGVVVAGVSP